VKTEALATCCTIANSLFKTHRPHHFMIAIKKISSSFLFLLRQHRSVHLFRIRHTFSHLIKISYNFTSSSAQASFFMALCRLLIAAHLNNSFLHIQMAHNIISYDDDDDDNYADSNPLVFLLPLVLFNVTFSQSVCTFWCSLFTFIPAYPVFFCCYHR
jgi:hypothetical protein